MADLLFELRCEELPARTLPRAVENLRVALEAELAAAGLPSAVTSAYTPRRIALFAAGLPGQTAAKEETVRGPRASAAFDAAGAPTKAAEGFARKQAVAASDLIRDGDFVAAIVRSGGRAASDVIAEILPRIPAKAGFAKTMRWGAPEPFARPIRSVVALLGSDVIAVAVNGLTAGRSTVGHPFLAPAAFDLPNADAATYVSLLRERFVLVDPVERSARICEAARASVVGASDGEAAVELPEDLLVEVTNLVEWPSALLGNFDARFLDLPPRLLTTVMAHHQRFFPVRRGAPAQSSLANHFVAILDRDTESVAPSRRGFERVLVPRLHDAMFFLDEDKKKPLEARLDRLKTVTYHKKLGTTFDKAKRLETLAPQIAEALGADAAEQTRAARAGLLAKCDLASLLVGEFPELQGHVGAVYAAREGEAADIAAALDLQYVHDFEGVTPPSRVALALLLSENLDVVAQFGANVSLPTGSADPFGVRRAAITLLDACERFAPDLDVSASILRAGGNSDVFAYVDTRLRQRFRDRGNRADFVDAVSGWTSVGEFAHKISVLNALAADPAFDRVLEVAERCHNITKKAEGAAAPKVSANLLVEPAEKELWREWCALSARIPADGLLSPEHAKLIAASLAQPLHQFFTDVLVNAEDAAVRGNRLALLTDISRALSRLGDLSRIAGKPR